LQCVASAVFIERANVVLLSHITCSVLQCVIVCCNGLLCVAVCCSVL